MQPYIVPSSFAINLLAKKYKSKIYALKIRKTNILQKIEFFLSNFLNLREFKIYRSFNVSLFLFYSFFKVNIFNIFKYFLIIKKKIKTKKDLENIRVKNILLGDLIYDSFLKQNLTYTININSFKFNFFLMVSLAQFFYIFNLFKKYNVKAVITSHPVYDLAIPLRIAVQKGIPAYQTDIHDIRRYTKKRIFFNNFFDYPKIKKKISAKIIKKGMILAKKNLEKRLFKGKSDLIYSKTKLSKKNQIQQIKKNGKINVLVASHCFSDSPHSFGNNLFPDFHEWFTFLSKISKITNYNWYIKTHSEYEKTTREYIVNFVKNNPQFNLLDPNTSHIKLVDEGIDYCLTVYGTIAHEYAFLGKKVINASVNNPHVIYNFNYHPRTISEYKKLLMNLKKYKKHKVNQSKILEYYFFYYIFFKNYLFIKDHNKFFNKLKNYKLIFQDSFYSLVINNKTDFKDIIRRLGIFFDKGYNQFSMLN